MEDFTLYKEQLIDILESGAVELSDIKPSDWAEENLVMPKPFPGPFRYSKTPYTREIIDCLAADHPARDIAVMKGAQVGFSSGVIMPGAGWIIKNNPGNTFITVGAPDLIEKAMEKLDLMIDGSGLRPYIKPQVLRNRMNKSGDTNTKKDFSGGYITVSSANNHKAVRQVDLQYGFFDDFESVKSESKESGSTRKLWEQRFAAYADTAKRFWISTPERKEDSNIEEAYLLGDQRKFHIPCPCCGEMITLEWSIEAEINGESKMCGITWKADESGYLISDSVGYICQKCGDFFDDKEKQSLLQKGIWIPTAKPSREGFYSYHLSSLYAPIGMYDWQHYVSNYIEANPPNQPQNEALMKSFTNLCLGLPFEGATDAPKANQIMKNCRDYDVDTIPESMSIADGNGKIVMLTCAADMNGVVDDARLDYEVVAWSESGASYSIRQGSIGTFIPREGNKNVKADRTHYTYEDSKQNSVWADFDEVLTKTFITDTGREISILCTGLDTGHYTTHAYAYMARTNNYVLGLKGDKDDKYLRADMNLARFKQSMERSDLHIVQVGLIKDTLSDYMSLRWNDANGSEQPQGFMNFPTPSNKMYTFNGFFSHYESEHRTFVQIKDSNNVASRWVKKSSAHQNHFFDCRVYNIAIKEIVVSLFGKELKRKPFTWKDYCAIWVGE